MLLTEFMEKKSKLDIPPPWVWAGAPRPTFELAKKFHSACLPNRGETVERPARERFRKGSRVHFLPTGGIQAEFIISIILCRFFLFYVHYTMYGIGWFHHTYISRGPSLKSSLHILGHYRIFRRSST